MGHWGRRRKDSAEFKLDTAIAKGEPWAVMFTLKNAPDRDYSGKPHPEATPNWRDDARRLGIDPDTFLVAVNRVLVELAATNAGDSVKSAAVES